MNRVFATRCLLPWAIVLLQLTIGPAAFAQDTEPRVPPSVDSTAPLTADEIISTLRFDPDLLLRTKNLMIQKATDQGSFLDPAELTDEAVFRSIREDARTRALVAHEIRDYGRVKSPPVYRDESDAPPDDSGMNPAGQPGSSRAEPGVPRDESTTYSDRQGGYRDEPQGYADQPDAHRRDLRPLPGEVRTPQEERKATVPRPVGPDRRIERPLPPEDQNQPATRGRPNPYPDLPSTKDLYRQLRSGSEPVRRFGDDIFLNGTGNLDTLPMDLPAGSDYVLGPGDGLNINLWGSLSQRFNVTVDRGGQVVLPDSGSVTVVGHTLAEAKEMIQKALSAQYKTARIEVSLTRLRTIRVYVVGDVRRPGAYDISSLSTPLNALYAAGGPTVRGSLRSVKHYRGQQVLREVDLYDLILNGVRMEGERLNTGDTILVPPVGPQVTVAGMVRRPAIYELTKEKDLAEVLQLAGGVLVSATLRQISVERIEAHERRIMLSLNLPEKADGDIKAMQQALGGFLVQDGDRVTISPILPYSEQTVYLQGHVFRPGKFPYRQGIQISDLIRSYQDLLPEPAQHAEIVRLVPPDYRPVVIEFKLEDVLGGDDPIDLQPFDTIRIFGRYEIDPPKVSIYGEVLRPGIYPLNQGMTAAALVRMAGGFKRSAFTREADITSYVVQNGEKVHTKHGTVEIAKALTGDNAADVALKPNDVLTIRQLAGWSDIGASVTIKGEVVYPGTYGIEDGERLSSFLKGAGGFRSNAYAEGALLERVQVREVAELSRADLIRRIEAGGTNPTFSASTSGQDQASLLQAMTQQQDHVLTALRSQPASGRLVISITSDIEHWQNTGADVELRAGDVITIPKKPGFVVVAGQVYNPAALTYTPGKNAGWYLRQAGGPTDLSNRKGIYIIHANGSVVGRGNGSLWSGGVLDAAVGRGDTVVVPERILGGSHVWKNVLDTAQLSSSLAIAARVATSF